MSIVSDYKAINAKLNGIDIDKEAFRATFKTFYEAYNLETYKAYGIKVKSFEEYENSDMFMTHLPFYKALITHLMDHGYSP